jgi:hypothetical protein
MEIVDRIQRGDVITKAVVLQEAKPKESTNKSGDTKKANESNRGGKKR